MLTDAELDELVARTATVTDDDLTLVPLQSLRPAPPRRRRLPTRRVFAGALAAAALAAIALLVVAARDGEQAGTAWAAPLVKLAEDSPLILLDAPGLEGHARRRVRRGGDEGHRR